MSFSETHFREKRTTTQSKLMSIFIKTMVGLFSCISKTTFSLPLSDCYVLDRENYLYDFTDFIGKELESEGTDSDVVLRFCKDVQNRSQNGYVSYGRFFPDNKFSHTLGDDASFFQEYKYGDLMLCEHNGFEFTGRETQVKIICGACPNGDFCNDDFGCLCHVKYHQYQCKVDMLVAINCSQRGPRISRDLAIGFEQRGSEVVKNGFTQLDFQKPNHNNSFETSQKTTSLYITAAPIVKETINRDISIEVQPEDGLSVDLSTSSATGVLKSENVHMLLDVNWKCRASREEPYEVKITLPLVGYDPIEFFLCKLCETSDPLNSTNNWIRYATNSLIVIILAAIVGLGIAYRREIQYHLLRRQGQNSQGLETSSLLTQAA